MNLGYAIVAARNGDPDGEAHWMLMELRKSKLTDSNLLDAFYDKIIESYDCAENYYIVLIHAAYIYMTAPVVRKIVDVSGNGRTKISYKLKGE